MVKKTKPRTAITREYFAANPHASVLIASKVLDIPAKYIHQIRYMDKKKGVPKAQAKPVNIDTVHKKGDWKTALTIASSTPIKTDMVNAPPHYRMGGIETIDFIEAKKLSYNLGNVVKYITRAKHKGDFMQDLEKAQWYLSREIYLARFPSYGKEQAVANAKREG